jgi:RNA polymerase-binding transcription factor DksA
MASTSSSKGGKSSGKRDAVKAKADAKPSKADAKPAKAEGSGKRPAVAKAPAPRRAEPAPKPIPKPQLKAKPVAPKPLPRIVEAAPMPVNGAACPFSKDELREWRDLLLERRTEIATDINHLEKDAMEAEDGHTTPNHIAERGSDAEMQDMSLGLAGEEQMVLWQIDRAIRKIDSGDPLPFGLCEHTKQPIPKTRLQLIPWTPLSIEGATYIEENGLTMEDVLVDG